MYACIDTYVHTYKNTCARKRTHTYLERSKTNFVCSLLQYLHHITSHHIASHRITSHKVYVNSWLHLHREYAVVLNKKQKTGINQENKTSKTTKQKIPANHWTFVYSCFHVLSLDSGLCCLLFFCFFRQKKHFLMFSLSKTRFRH